MRLEEMNLWTRLLEPPCPAKERHLRRWHQRNSDAKITLELHRFHVLQANRLPRGAFSARDLLTQLLAQHIGKVVWVKGEVDVRHFAKPRQLLSVSLDQQPSTRDGHLIAVLAFEDVRLACHNDCAPILLLDNVQLLDLVRQVGHQVDAQYLHLERGHLLRKVRDCTYPCLWLLHRRWVARVVAQEGANEPCLDHVHRDGAQLAVICGVGQWRLNKLPVLVVHLEPLGAPPRRKAHNNVAARLYDAAPLLLHVKAETVREHDRVWPLERMITLLLKLHAHCR
mmetsp:Transcript_60671/g.166204  ORF Transcript_60671/g.166204 Transcript_60671/m.166204 type:complete len:282 (+) Transcript_60671:937-1782(+)